MYSSGDAHVKKIHIYSSGDAHVERSGDTDTHTELGKYVYNGNLPNRWKIANVTPIFKKGSPSEPGNYRPISITSICCKLFESGIKTELMHYLLENSLISTSQHAFLSNRSTCT